MSSANPFVSVIVPAYNAARFLSGAVDNIRDQSYQPLEIIIVDDGSTDGTADLATSLGEDIRYVRQNNRGPAAARNTGLAMARGSVIAFLDADDLWPKDKLHIQVKCLTDNQNVDVVLGHTQQVALPGAAKWTIQGLNITLVSVYLGSAVFRRSVFEKVGVFDDTLYYSEDHDWFLRAREQGVSMIVAEHITLYHRLHEHNMTRERNPRDLGLLEVLKMSLDRRRRNNTGLARSLPTLSDCSELNTRLHADLEKTP